MSDKPADGAVMPSSATSGVNEEQLQQMIQKVTMGIFKEAVPRLVQQAINQSIPTMLDKMAEEALKDSPGETAPADNVASEEKTTLKTLKSQLEQLTKGIQERDRKLQEADQRTREIRLNSEIQSHFARHLGADSPHLAPYVNHFKSQFLDHEGNAVRKSKNDYGEEVFVPAAQAIDELFKNELKHLVQQSRVSHLPPTGRNGIGQQIRNQIPQNPQQPQGARNNPLALIAQELAETRPEAAQILMDDAQKMPAPTPVNRNQ